MRYDDDGLAVPDVTYTYAQAVREGVCRPVAFVTYDGSLSWRSGEDVIESSFESVLPAREAARRYRTAISTELPDGLPRILREADAKLTRLRADGHRDAGGLVVASDGAHARRVSRLLSDATGRTPVVVLHTEARAAHKLAAFAGSSEPWLVAVNMVSEGVDIPRLRVGVYATAAKTPLAFRQIVGRFVRTLPGQPAEPSWLYLPADPLLRRHAAEVEGELRRALRHPEPADGEQERASQRKDAAERSAFLPLSADVAPQMTLFGPAPGAPPARSLVQGPVQRPREAEPVPEAPAMWERRARLRERRHRLVADLRRREGSSHREINLWLNRSVGVTRVDDASVAQLERSVEVLLRRLATRT